MASWNEIDRVRKDPKVFKPLAAHLLRVHETQWGDYEETFLRDVSEYDLPELNTRQAEFLLKCRDDKATHFKVGDNFSVPFLVKKCYEARLDLDHDDLDFIETLYRRNRAYVTGRQAGWLLRVAEQLHIIEPYS
jgi:hypothetical protein